MMDSWQNVDVVEVDQVLPSIIETTNEFGTSSVEEIPGDDEANMECTNLVQDGLFKNSTWHDQNMVKLTTEDIKQLIFQSWEDAETFYIQYSR